MARSQISHSPVNTLVRSACRRRLLLVAMEQLALALAGIFAGAIVILLLGTRTLDARWLALLAGAGLLITVFRVRRNLLAEYRVAQILDDRLRLSDTLSTAWFLLSRTTGRDAGLESLQIERAEAVAARVKAQAAFPFTGQRAYTLMIALAAGMFGLLAFRYAGHQRVDFRDSLVPLHVPAMVERGENILSAEYRRVAFERVRGETGPQSGSEAGSRASSDSQNGNSASEQGASEGNAAAQDQQAAKAAHSDNSASQNLRASESGAERGAAEKATESGSSDKAQSSLPSGARPRQQNQEQQSGGQQSSSGLLDKMKDALSSLMAKMNASSQKSPQNADQASDQQKDPEQSADSRDQNARSQQGRSEPSDAGTNSEQREQGTTPRKGSIIAGPRCRTFTERERAG